MTSDRIEQLRAAYAAAIDAADAKAAAQTAHLWRETKAVYEETKAAVSVMYLGVSIGRP